MERTLVSANAGKSAVMCCDPSLAAFGFVVMQGMSILSKGCIKTETGGKKLRIRKGDDRVRRVTEINVVLLKHIRKYNVQYIFAELPHGSQSAAAAMALGLATSIVQTISDTLEIGLEWYSEADSKRALLGKNTAAKDETIKATGKIYSIQWSGIKYKDEAIADSLSIHNVAVKKSQILKLLK